jgi:hypothetical protein
MAYVCDRPHFTVTVSSGFVSHWEWAVHAVVDYRALQLAGRQREIESQAQAELMIGISSESRVGRDRGARNVSVLVEGDREMAGFFRGLEELPEASSVA